MLGKCFSVISLSSILYAIFHGNLEALSSALFDGAAQTMEVALSLLGITALWCGFLNVLTACGAIGWLSRFLSPILALAFPETFRSGEGAEEITACVSANLLGVSNAATPSALRAMEKMAAHASTKGVAESDMITLVLLSSSGVSLFPSTIVALRQIAGSAAPTSILIPVWITSLSGAIISVLLSRLCAAQHKKNSKVGRERKRTTSPHLSFRA